MAAAALAGEHRDGTSRDARYSDRNVNAENDRNEQRIDRGNFDSCDGRASRHVSGSAVRSVTRMRNDETRSATQNAQQATSDERDGIASRQGETCGEWKWPESSS